MDITQLMQDAEKGGIATSYYDIDGHLIHTSPSTLHYFTQLLKSAEQHNRLEPAFDDCVIYQENTPVTYDLARLGLTEPIALDYRLICDDKLVIEQSLTSPQSLSFAPLSFGYYDLHIQTQDKQFHVRFLISPHTAYQPVVFQEKKCWGINIQLYSLRSKHNWGIGDFADLAYLVEQAARHGADFIGINPLHLMYSSDATWASPYSASSRRWMNPIYLDIEGMPEFSAQRSMSKWLLSEEVQSHLQSLRDGDLVDYAAVNALKMTALKRLFEFSKKSKTKKIIARRQAFQHFVKQQGDALKLQGLFQVLDQQTERHETNESNLGWLGWQAEWRRLSPSMRKSLLTKHRDDIEFYAWLQWLCVDQLEQIQGLCHSLGMKLGIYGDLAVSSARGSVDVWSDPELYFIEASVGAPPDPLGPIGQNWNLPPYNPIALKKRGFQPFIDMLRANMQHFGVLRIDHIIGLFRLWLIPPHENATAGAYVHYPFEELMTILAIESHRNQCLVIGEDLGTVPNEVRSKLNELQILSYFVLYFEQRHRQFPRVEHFPANAFATIGTHDLPSLTSFWHCDDLRLFEQLGVLTGDVLKGKYDQRVEDKQALLDSLHRDNYLPPHYEGDAMSMAMHAHLNYVIHQYLAHSNSRLVGVQLENLIDQAVSFNLPGTHREYPNWRKKLARGLEDIFEDPKTSEFLTALNQARQTK